MSKDKKSHIDWDNVMTFSLIIMVIIVVGVAIYSVLRYKPIRRSAAENEYLIYVSRNQDAHANTYIYYDKDTKVMYMINYHGGITVMVNPDGTPRLYEEDVNE